MQLSMLDKLFFLDKIDCDSFVDFGCADGTLLRHIQMMKPDAKLVGYDNDCNMIKIAKKQSKDITFTCDWDSIKNKENSALILSSVLHEVYSYSSPKEINEFWIKVHNANFKYIIIRDMAPSKSIDRPSDMNDVTKIYDRANFICLETFEHIWGSIENSHRTMIHFLLKYRYEENWNREVRENYIPSYREEIMRSWPVTAYNIVYHEHYILPYIKQQVKKDFDIDIKDNTHLKLIIKRRE